uniref:Uncharacterized protein n=1 Tax=Oryza barthii TaxID=65489 RepID=A0A0D3HJZ4_9ORYZ
MLAFADPCVSISMILKFEIIFRLHNKIAFVLEFGVNVTTGMRASGLQDPVALVSIGGWSPNQGTPQLAIVLNPSFLRRRWGLCPGWPYWAAAMGLSDLTLSTELEPMGLSSTEQGNRQVEPRGKSMGTAIDSEPTAIDLFNELHCSKTKGFSEPVKKAIENYCHCINDDVIDVLWWSQKLVSDPPSVMTAILSQQAGSDRKQAVIVIM